MSRNYIFILLLISLSAIAMEEKISLQKNRVYQQPAWESCANKATDCRTSCFGWINAICSSSLIGFPLVISLYCGLLCTEGYFAAQNGDVDSIEYNNISDTTCTPAWYSLGITGINTLGVIGFNGTLCYLKKYRGPKRRYKATHPDLSLKHNKSKTTIYGEELQSYTSFSDQEKKQLHNLISFLSTKCNQEPLSQEQKAAIKRIKNCIKANRTKEKETDNTFEYDIALLVAALREKTVDSRYFFLTNCLEVKAKNKLQEESIVIESIFLKTYEKYVKEKRLTFDEGCDFTTREV